MSEKTALLEAAYDEYCRVQESSGNLDVEQFLSRYSTIRSSLRRQICVHDFLANRSHIVDLCRDVQWPSIGDTVFDFSILEELGRGAFARVYLCRQVGIGGRLVVVKFAAEGAYEADMLGRFSHPNIMPVHSVEADELSSLSAICMPFRGRATLCDLIDRTFSTPMTPPRGDTILRVAREDIGPGELLDDAGPPDPFLKHCSYEDGVIHLGIQLAEAIAHAHSRGVRHGDLKPSNVLLAASGRPMLLDFNLAIRESAGGQAPGGTMPYMSPEQLAAFYEPDNLPTREGESRAVGTDEQSDVFSLGVILFELLTGKLPFGEVAAGAPASERAQTLATAQARGPQSLQTLNRRVDRRAARLIEQCLAVDKSQRPASAAALASELRGQLSLLRRGERWTIRNKVLAASLAAVLALSAGTAAAFVSLREPYATRQYKQALENFKSGQMDRAITLLDPMIAATPKDADALYLRGMARLSTQNYRAAIDDLEAARRVKPDPKFQAAQAYCLCRLNYYSEARFLYTKAMEAGYREIDALNNLAYCHLLKRNTSEASALLYSAVEKGPVLVPVLWNRVTAVLESQPSARVEDLEQAIADSLKVLELAPGNAHCELLSARVFALSALRNPQHLNASLDHLESASQRGLSVSRKDVEGFPEFSALRSSDRFKKLVTSLPGAGEAAAPDRLVQTAPSLPAD